MNIFIQVKNCKNYKLKGEIKSKKDFLISKKILKVTSNLQSTEIHTNLKDNTQ